MAAVRLLIYSDLHNEFEPFVPPPEAVAEADVVVLAGDIHKRVHAIEWAKATFPGKPVVQVAGNHEFYGSNFYSNVEKMRAAAAGSNVHFLEDAAVVIDGVRFLGCTLWTSMRLFGTPDPWMMQELQRLMNDYRYIRNDRENYRRIITKDVAWRHEASMEWLRSELAKPFGGKTVVVTHHAPTLRSVPGWLYHERITLAFASDLDDLLVAPVDLWIHGHIHVSRDYRVYEGKGTRVVCNPRGYLPYEPNPSFQEGLLVEV